MTADPQRAHRRPAVILVIAGILLVVLGWRRAAGDISSWALRNEYFSTAPMFTVPAGEPLGVGPTPVTTVALLAVLVAVITTGLAVVQVLAPPVVHRPYDRRPLPPVFAPVAALCAGLFGSITLLGIPFTPDYLAVAFAAIAAVVVGDWMCRRLRTHRTKVQYLNELESTLLPYLGFDVLPRYRVVAISEWNAASDVRPARPKTIMLAYSGRREELHTDKLSQRLDEAAGAHYSLDFSSVDQLIAATVVSDTTEPPVVRRLRQQISNVSLFGAGATVTDTDYSASGDLVRFTVRHKVAAQLAGTSRPRTIERKIGELLPGNWRAARWDHVNAIAVFELRRELPTRVFPPIVPAASEIEYVRASYDAAAIPLAVDSNSAVVSWRPAHHPHSLIVSPAGSGKTSTIRSLIVSAARLGWRIFVVDVTAGELVGYRNFPNVVSVLTESHEAIAVVNVLYREMATRREIHKRSRKALSSKEPLLLVIDDLDDLEVTLNRFYDATKQPSEPQRCPTFDKLADLLHSGGDLRMHCLATAQSDDLAFLDGAADKIFASRLRFRSCSETQPFTLRQRGLAHDPATGRDILAQAFYMPNPLRPLDPAEADIVSDLKPSVCLYDRGVIMPPDSLRQPFSHYQTLPLLKADDHPEYDPTSRRYRAPSWRQVDDPGIDSIFGSLPSRGTVRE